MDALLGTKVGMTQVFDDTGRQIPVTVLSVGPCTVVQRKTTANDGYEAVQLGYRDQKEHRLTKPLRGHFGAVKADAKKVLREVRVQADASWKGGDTVDASVFEGVEFVDVIAVTKGRGFQGVVKRWNMRGGRKTHGGGGERTGGSIGMCEYPARVLKGKKMPGQMGNRRMTQHNLKVVSVRPEDHAVLVRGAVPGPNGATVVIRRAIKAKAKTS